MVGRIRYASSLLLLGAMIQLVTGLLLPTWGGLLVGVGQSFLAEQGWQWLEPATDSRKPRYGTAGLALGGIVLGGALRYLSLDNAALPWPFEGWAIFAALVTSSGMIAYSAHHHRNYTQGCNLCGRRLTAAALPCPRCSFQICGRVSCWDEKRLRCMDCDHLQRPLLSLEEPQWWTERLGARLRNGTCYHCRNEAADCDLRQCGQCLKAMCIFCWDLENGGCIRCGWLLPALPEALLQLLTEAALKQARTSAPT